MANETELGKAVIPIRAALDQLDGDLSDARGRVNGALGGIARVAGVATTAIVGGGIAAAGALGSLAAEAAPLEGIQNAFAGITGDAEGMLSALRDGALGMATDADLMESYNSAAQLVGKTFADQLPDAMGYLGQVAAATGEDMGFMLDSLVKGVGRLSPQILDNLGIQVNLTDAVANWAAESGMAATATINNTDAMHDMGIKISETEAALAIAVQRQSEFTDATSESARMAAQLKIDKLTQDLDDYQMELEGLSEAHGTTYEDFDALAESMTKAQQQEAMMAETMRLLAENTADMPDIADNAATKMAQLESTMANLKAEVGMALLPVFTEVMGIFGELMTTYGPMLTDVMAQLGTLLGDVIGGALETLIPSFVSLMETLGPLAESLMGALFPALAAVLEAVIPLAAALIGALAPVLEAVLQAVLPIAVALIELLAPILADLATGLIPLLVPLIEGLAEIFGRLLMAVMPLVETLLTELMPVFLQIIEAVLPPLIDVLLILLDLFVEYVEATLPNFIAILEIIMPLIGDLAVIVAEGLGLALRVLAGILDTVVRPAFQWVMDHLFYPLLDILERMKAGLEGVTGWFKNLGKTIGDLELPPWLIPGSPTPLEIGLSGIGDQVARVTGLLGGFDAGLSMSVMGGGSGGQWSGDIYINGAGDPQATAAAVIRALKDRGMMPQTSFR